MTIIEMIWMVTLGVAVTCAVADMFVVWLDGAIVGADWRCAIRVIASQWIVLFSMALILTVILEGRG